ncbi:metallophosphoesterase family protein [Oceanomicrobium pacificus]|uniref:Calcineurin-like phosphoesterase domain-containing protein n=1 Tax=Oceanomicrobium pacificus TaxID=2692916 RepID=A0A6B0TZP5_9RHOB|nr:metallophosphoesterase [Oceanomicrobium pacificus]MXU66464.1 hypothetical protein [Oceanomicrobium pacificus]
MYRSIARRLEAAVLLLVLAVVLIAGPVRAQSLRIAVVSDLNGSYGSVTYSDRVDAAIARIIELKPDLVLSTGDMVAGQRTPTLSASRVAEMWAAFHRHVSDPLAKAGIPFAVTAGNHDASGYPAFRAERERYAQEWRARKPALDYLPGGNYPFVYGFRFRDVIFVSLDATTVGKLSGDEMRWLDTALAAPARARIAFSHIPLHPFAIGREREIIGDPLLESLFQTRDLSVHLSGHHHAYFPGWKDGVGYVSQACLGGGPRPLVGTGSRSPHGFTWMEIAADGSVTTEALLPPDYRRALDITTLPKAISGPLGRVIRRDLAPVQ